MGQVATSFKRSFSGEGTATARCLVHARRIRQARQTTTRVLLPNAIQRSQVRDATWKLSGRFMKDYVFIPIGILGSISGPACKSSRPFYQSEVITTVQNLVLSLATLQLRETSAMQVSSGQNRPESILMLSGTLGSLLPRAWKTFKNLCSGKATLVVQDRVLVDLVASPEIVFATMAFKEPLFSA